MTSPSFAACRLLTSTPAFQADFALNRLMLRQAIAEGRLRLYHLHQGGKQFDGRTWGRELYIPAIWLGPCLRVKKSKSYSRVLIPMHGRPHVMTHCKNSQLMTLAEYRNSEHGKDLERAS